MAKIRYHPLIIRLRQKIPHVWVNRLKHLPTAVLANLVYGWPSRKLLVVGVTGTKGKTTTAVFLHHLLEKSGLKTGLISTIAAKIGEKEIDTGFHVTAPDHFPLQALLAQMVKRGLEYVVLEVTSHGLEQYRFWGINFSGGIITNVAEDHLDYHGTWKKYLLAKAKLFAKTQFAVLNVEDRSYPYLKDMVKGKIITYGRTEGDLNLKNCPFNLPLKDDFNKLNLLAAIATAQLLGVDKINIQRALLDLSLPVGRMEVIQKEPLVVVDFAHTPQSLAVVLASLRRAVKPHGRLIAVFGCAGERDPGRRKMGKLAAELADITVITAEDPRTEGVKKISGEIAFWAKKGGAKEASQEQVTREMKQVFLRIDDREKAIEKALELVEVGDVVGIFGKGHEQSMCFGRIEYPWSDQKAVKKILQKKRV